MVDESDQLPEIGLPPQIGYSPQLGMIVVSLPDLNPVDLILGSVNHLLITIPFLRRVVGFDSRIDDPEISLHLGNPSLLHL